MTAEFDPMGHENFPADMVALERLCNCADFYGIAVEIGSWAGSTALLLNMHFNRVFCVDHWEGTFDDPLAAVSDLYSPRQAFTTFCRNIGEDLFDDVYPCVGRSLTWASVWNRPIDFLFIDGDHRYHSVRADILAWLPHVRVGGIIAVHDYGALEGVTRAVDELLPDRKIAGLTIAYMGKEA